MPHVQLPLVIRRAAGRVRRLLSDAPKRVGVDHAAAQAVRRQLAEQYLRGNGLEVGALNEPLWVPEAARVHYVDRMSVADLRRQYPELTNLPLVDIDIIDDGERLTKVADLSQDFLVSNHFIEHTQDPIGTIARHLEVLKSGGILYMAVPDKQYTFDSRRPVTSFDHLLRDWREGPAGSYEEHLSEYATLVDNTRDLALKERIAFLRRTNYSIHFHVWTDDSLRDFLGRLASELSFPMILETMIANPGRHENICIIRKR